MVTGTGEIGGKMRYHETVKLRDGSVCVLRNGEYGDGEVGLDFFCRTHAQTEFLLTYADESTMTIEDFSKRLEEQTESERGIEMLADIDGELVGMAGIEPVGTHEKVRHRAEFGITVDREHWGKGIGRVLANACVECARRAGFLQLELDVVADNERAIALYESMGFVEWGRNPRGFLARSGNYQELVHMRLELDK